MRNLLEIRYTNQHFLKQSDVVFAARFDLDIIPRQLNQTDEFFSARPSIPAQPLHIPTSVSRQLPWHVNILRRRVKDASDLGKTIQEVKYLAEAVASGIRSTLQGFGRGCLRKTDEHKINITLNSSFLFE
ncbi:hypothetical protein MKW98_015794 [Papaver atlanticum]|uniref:Uncharacterized protein n=1 Tax=Papaver atlanticum TaxID=357466 RepID=A0AAD4XBI3_9MAGN|nr:hypothetical protein MKW98_015794 [Papaver atlanticum]